MREECMLRLLNRIGSLYELSVTDIILYTLCIWSVLALTFYIGYKIGKGRLV
jgi:hypothetical protein